jgi:hypothetical protein
MFQHTKISQGTKLIYGGEQTMRANYDCDTYAKAFWENEEAAGALVTSTYLCDKPWSLWIQG